MLKLWHELQEINPDLDNLGSNHNCLPSSTFAGSVIFAGCIGCIGSLIGAAAHACTPSIKLHSATHGLITVFSFTLWFFNHYGLRNVMAR